MEKLNNKIQRTRAQKLDSVQATGLYGYNSSDDTYNRADVSDNGDLHVNIHGTTGGGDLKARTNINDSSTSTFLKCNADGSLEMTAELTTAGLATEAKQDAGNNTLSSIDNKIILPSVLNSDQLKVNDSAVVGSLAVINNNITDGSAKIQILGNTEGDGSGTSEHLHTDGNGNLNVQVISTVNTTPANDTNSGITNDPANSVAVGLRARQTITDASTETFLKCNSDGELLTSGGGGGGDASAANQLTINSTLGDTNSKIDAMRASDSLTTVKDSVVQNLTDGSTKAKIMGLFSGGQYQVATDGDGHLQVDVLSGGGGGTQFAGGDALAATGTGTAMIGRDSGNVARLAAVDTDGHLQIDIVGNSDTTKATSTLQTAGNATLVNIENNLSSIQSTVDSNRLKVSGNNATHGTIAQLAVGTGSTGALSNILNTAGYSKVLIICKNSSNTSTSIMASALWSDDASFTGGTDLVMNSDDLTGSAFSPVSFQTATSADSTTFIGSQAIITLTPPAQYVRINCFQATGSTINVDFFYILAR